MFPGVPEESLETAKEKAQKAKEVMQDPERAKEAAQEAARKASQKTMEAKEKVKAEAEETAPGHQHPLCSLSLKVLRKKDRQCTTLDLLSSGLGACQTATCTHCRQSECPSLQAAGLQGTILC